MARTSSPMRSAASATKRARWRPISQASRPSSALPIPLIPTRKTIFLTITCGQAVRNFLLSDVLGLLTERYNVVILTPFAYSEKFRKAYAGPGVHVLPWFTSFRSATERLFQYYLMRKSGSSTHQGWLANLETQGQDGD